MSELVEAYHEAMAAVGDVRSSWQTVFIGAAKRLNETAKAMVGNPAQGSELAGYVGRLNPAMKAQLIATYKPFRPGTVLVVENDVHGQFITGSSDATTLADDPKQLDQMAKDAVIAEMVGNPKVWLTAYLRKGTHAGRKN